MPVLLPLLVATLLGAEPECRSAHGKTACGYHCNASYGQVKCAQTPEGTCVARYGKVTCWDPPRSAHKERRGERRHDRRSWAGHPPEDPSHEWEPRGHRGVRGRHAGPLDDLPQPTCRSAYGTTACGYACTASYGQVECAQTPQGICAAAYGEVTCWDPPGWVRRRHPDARPECRSGYGMTACGFHCSAGYGVVRCAQTPEGNCVASGGDVVCWDW